MKCSFFQAICVLLALLCSCGGKELNDPHQPTGPVVAFTSHVVSDTIIALSGDTLDIAAHITSESGLKELKQLTVTASGVARVFAPAITQFANSKEHSYSCRLPIDASVKGFKLQATDVDEHTTSTILNIKVVDRQHPIAIAFVGAPDTFRVNVGLRVKPLLAYTVASVEGIDSVWHLTNVGVLAAAKLAGLPQAYSGSVTGITDQNMQSVMVKVRDAKGSVFSKSIPVSVYNRPVAKPTITFVEQSDTLRVNLSLLPTISYSVASEAALDSVVAYAKTTTRSQVSVITSFSGATSYSGTIPATTSVYTSSLTAIVIRASDEEGNVVEKRLPVKIVTTTEDRPVAFPGAEGFAAATTTGGRGGAIYYVTNLNDAGAGSLRDAVSKSGPRIIMFKVSGTIALSSNLEIKNGNVTIAGQTAPGDGICLKNYTLQVKASNVIIRYMRFRPGDYVVGVGSSTEPDAAEGQNQSNIIIDHCTMSWSIDELSSWYANTNFTLQWCMLYESLRNSGHSKGAHGYTGLWGGNKASFHHNLVAHSDSRNPRIAHPLIEERNYTSFTPGVIDVRNNVFYNWGGNSGYGGEGRKANFINNYYKSGPNTGASRRHQIFEPYWTSEDAYKINSTTLNYPASPLGVFYASGNYVEGSASVTADNWLGFATPKDGAGGSYKRSSATAISAVSATADQIAAMKRAVPHDTTGGWVTTHAAENVYAKVLLYAGASLYRDAADTHVANSVEAGTGSMVDRPGDVGGYPTLNSVTAPADTDNDGMPDAWEVANGLNKNLADGNAKNLSSFYTNVEVYLNSLVLRITQDQQK